MAELYDLYHVLLREILASWVSRVDDHHHTRLTCLPGTVQGVLQLLDVDGPVSVLVQHIAYLQDSNVHRQDLVNRVHSYYTRRDI